MREALKKYWVILVSVLVVSAAAVGVFGFQFIDRPLSSSSEHWAHFATYISGTVGVVVVAGTLMALMITLGQQSKLIDQQDCIILQQEHLRFQTEEHQIKVEAYSRAEKFFPALLQSCEKDLDAILYDRLREKGWAAVGSEYLSPRVALKDLFDEEMAPPDFEESGRLYFSSLWGEFLQKPYSLALLVAGCLKDADELRAYFYSELGEYKKVMACALIYYRLVDKENVDRVSKILGFPSDYSGTDVIQARWQRVGEKCFGETGV